MKKKSAQGLSIEYVIIAAIGFIVLVIIAIIFRTHSTRYSKGYSDTADSAIESAKGNRCQALFMEETRRCHANGPPTEGTWQVVEGKWTDCKENEQCYTQITSTDKQT